MSGLWCWWRGLFARHLVDVLDILRDEDTGPVYHAYCGVGWTIGRRTWRLSETTCRECARAASRRCGNA